MPTVHGTPGNDNITLPAHVSLGADPTYVFTYEGNDIVIDNYGTHIVDTGPGDDEFHFSWLHFRHDDADQVQLGPGNDYGYLPLMPNAGDGTRTLDGGEGLDTLGLGGINDLIGLPTVDFRQLAGNGSLYFANHTLSSFERVFLWDNNTISNVTFGDYGDYFKGFGYERNVVYGNGGDDYLQTGLGADELYGGPGNDTLVSGTGSSNFPQLIYGEEGDDVIARFGSRSASHLWGGTGSDGFVSNPSASDDRVRDFDPSEDWIGLVDSHPDNYDMWVSTPLDFEKFNIIDTPDLLSFQMVYGRVWEAAIVTYEYDKQTGELWWISDTNTRQQFMTLDGAPELTLDHFFLMTRQLGTQKVDILHGNDQDNYLWGFHDNDTIYGRGGNDRLEGDNGNDILFGEEGDDLLDGGDDNDVIHPGSGLDTIILGAGQDRVEGTLAELNGDVINDLTLLETIVVKSSPIAGFWTTQVSDGTVLHLDGDGDGQADAVLGLLGLTGPLVFHQSVAGADTRLKLVPDLPDPANDFDGDGTSDIGWFNPQTFQVGQWEINNGNSSWAHIGKGGAGWEIAGTGDFNGDGTDDLLWFNPQTFRVGQWEMSNGTSSWKHIGTGGAGWEIAGIGDFNGDGTDDLLWFNPQTLRVGQWEMNNGNSTWKHIGTGAAGWEIAGVGDFNGDGKDDLLWFNPQTLRVGQWEMNNGSSSWAHIGTGGAGWQIVGVGDFNGDFTDDTLWFNPNAFTVGQWEMNNGNAAWDYIGKAGPGWRPEGTGDYNGDGTDDILWNNPQTGQVGQFQMNNGNSTWDHIGWGGQDWFVFE